MVCLSPKVASSETGTAVRWATRSDWGNAVIALHRVDPLSQGEEARSECFVVNKFDVGM